MQAKRIMTVEVTCVPPEYPIGRAWNLMQKLHVRHLPVVSGGRLAGIVSDRDLLVRAVRFHDGSLEFPEITAGEAMSLCPVSCNLNTGISALAGLMIDRHIDALPIVEVDGSLLGLVTSTDLLELLRTREVVGEELPFAFTLKRADGQRLQAHA